MGPDPHSDGRTRGTWLALAAAALFGAGAPASKRLLAETGPLLLAGLLYLGAGAGIALARLTARAAGRRSGEPPLRRSDLPWIAVIALAGGAAGPVLLLAGLERTLGMAGALLLNLELPLTVFLAVAFFGEHLGAAEAGGAALVAAGAVLLGVRPGPASADAVGVLLVSGACLCWALDNNLTARLSLRDPSALAMAKGLSAGVLLVLTALATGGRPSAAQMPPALALGAISYGASIVLATHAMRRLGAARHAALFATAPFLGALASVPILGEVPTVADAGAGALMAAGAAMLLRARHEHLHAHEAIVHEHAHDHDPHHAHVHEGAAVDGHSHAHAHESVEHAHPHVSDAHHRHSHAKR